MGAGGGGGTILLLMLRVFPVFCGSIVVLVVGAVLAAEVAINTFRLTHHSFELNYCVFLAVCSFGLFSAPWERAHAQKPHDKESDTRKGQRFRFVTEFGAAGVDHEKKHTQTQERCH